MNARLNLHIYPTYFRHETRMLKETGSLEKVGYFDRILIAAIWDDKLQEREDVSANIEVHRIKLRTRRWRSTLGKVLRLAEWYLLILGRFSGRKVSVVNCHSLSVLPLGVLFKWLQGAAIVYDTHELETEVHGSTGVRRVFARMVERNLIRFVDQIITVSPSIAGWYQIAYGISNVHVVRNLPHATPRPEEDTRGLLRRHCGVGADELLFIYQGLFVEGRGIELLLAAWPEVGAGKHLVFMGSGPLLPKIQAAMAASKAISLHPPVPLKDIQSYTSGADVGVSLFEETCLNYRFALPNKLFEYLFSRVPVIVSDFPDMGAVVDEWQCGWKTSVSVPGLASLLRSLTRADVESKRSATERFRAENGWHVEEQRLLRAYEQIGVTISAAEESIPRGSPTQAWEFAGSPAGLLGRDSSPNAVVVRGFAVHLLSGWRNSPGGWSSDSAICQSEDGFRWQALSKAPAYDPYSAFIGFRGRYFAVAAQSFVSDDAETWLPVGRRNAFGNSGRLLEFQGVLWLQVKNELWRSADGVEWTLHLTDCPWGSRQWPGFVSHAGKMWLIGGGMRYGSRDQQFFNDVWSSADGSCWEKVCEHATWSPRYWSSVIVIAGRIWILGGWIPSSHARGAIRGNCNEVWSSADGIDWRRHYYSKCWSPRHAMYTWQCGGYVWVAGGYDGNKKRGPFTDVWRLKQ
jgi:glycosyltransferase involved in cell wall biosynthesis